MGRDSSREWSPSGEALLAIEALQGLADKGYMLPGVYGSLSIKSEGTNPYGEVERLLWMVGPGEDDLPGPERVPRLRLGSLRRLLELDTLHAEELENELHRARERASDPLPPWECLLHACFPERCVVHSCPPALLAAASSINGKERLAELFGDSLVVLEFAAPGIPVASLLSRSMRVAPQEGSACYLEGYGLWTAGSDAGACCQRVDEIEKQAKSYLQARGAWELQPLQPASPQGAVRRELASLRKELSDLLGRPVILNQDRGLAGVDVLQELEGARPPAFYHAQYTGTSPFSREDLGALGETAKAGSQDTTQAVFPPRVILDQELGACSTGFTASGAFRTAALFQSTAETWLRAERLGGYRAFPIKELEEAVLLSSPAFGGTGTLIYTGEIALVTGGASGIGKACVESLLERGAAVASMDLNPAVVKMYETPGYLGLHCDLTDEVAVMQAFEALARHFGGLDMLVLNAGIFPGGIRIESLELAHWQKVMNINMNSNLVVLREAHPLLRSSPKGGRVLVNGSKNVLAPGAGAAAYSASKAAVTQLARVAALEWGKDRIRINMIHPDQVMDTGIWTEEVIQARAAHYGLSVQAYRTRNLLGIELNSHYVGELVAEMLGPLFEKISGAQIPVDGGSDRTI